MTSDRGPGGGEPPGRGLEVTPPGEPRDVTALAGVLNHTGRENWVGAGSEADSRCTPTQKILTHRAGQRLLYKAAFCPLCPKPSNSIVTVQVQRLRVFGRSLTVTPSEGCASVFPMAQKPGESLVHRWGIPCLSAPVSRATWSTYAVVRAHR